MDFEESPSKGRLDIVVKVSSSTSKVPFIIDRLQFNTSSLNSMHDVKFLVWSFRKFSRNEAEIRCQNMCCSLLLADEK